VALLHLLDRYECKNFQVVAIDLVEARVKKAKSIVNQIGSLNGTVKCVNPEEAKGLVKELTDGIGCSAVIEVRLHMLYIYGH
jgi:hypothetical protein